MKKFLAAAAGLSLAAGLLAIAPAQAAGPTLTYGVNSTLRSYAASSGEIANKGPFFQAVYDTLLMKTPTGKVVPWLADKWAYDKKRTTLTLHIRKGVKFTNGVAVTPVGVKANIEAFLKGDSPAASDAGAVSTVSAKGENVIVKLKYPDPVLEDALAGPLYIQEPSQIGTDEGRKKPIGSGPYILNLEKTINDSVYYFDANPGYWNKAARKYDNLVLKVLTDATAQANALLTGAVDLMNLVDKSQIPNLKAKGVTIASQRLNWAGLTLVDRGGRMGTPLKNVKVRQAINMAFDRQALIQPLATGYGVATQQIFAEYNLGYDEKLNSTYSYDPTKAKALLAEAGYANGFTLEMPTTAAFAVPSAVVKQSLGDIGITVNFTDVPIANLFFAMQQPKFPAYYMVLGRPANSYGVIKMQIGRDASWNPAGYGDAKTDALISKIQTTADVKTLTSLYRTLNSYIVKQAWFAPILQQDATLGYNPKTVKVKLQPGNSIPYLLTGVSPA